MSSWFSGGLSQNLSQFTGQISNFTKEVLTDGTEEIDDHATHLKISQSRIAELESVCAAQRVELERLQQINEDSAEKLESSELQINAVSNEYRSIIQKKEAEIQALQHSEHEVTFRSSAPVGLDHEDEEGLFLNSNFFDDARQQTIGQIAFTGASGVYSPNAVEVDSAKLQHQIQTLETELRSSRDSHQAEFVALQDVHSQRIGLIKKRHKEEVRSFREQLQALDDGATDSQTASEGGATGGLPVKRNEKLELELQVYKERAVQSDALSAALKRENDALAAQLHSLQPQTTQTSGASSAETEDGKLSGKKEHETAESTIKELQAQLAEVNQERDSLIESLEELDSQNDEALQHIIGDRDTLKSSNKILKTKVDELESKCVSQVTLVELLKVKNIEFEVKHEMDAKFVTSLEEKIQQLQNAQKYGPLSQGVPKQLSSNPGQGAANEILTLEERIKVLEDEMTNLEDANVKLEAELNDTQEQLEIRPNLSHIDKNTQQEISHLKDKIKKSTEENIQLQETITEMSTETTQLQKTLAVVEENEKVVQNQVRHYESEVEEKETALARLTHDLNENVAARNTFIEGYSKLEQEVGDLREQLSISSREVQRLQECYQSSQSQLEAKTEEIRHVKSTSEQETKETTLSIQEKYDLKLQLKSLEEEKEELISHIDELQQSLLDLKHVQLEKFQVERIDLNTKIDSLTTQRESLERELASTEHKLRDQIKQQENYITELTQSRDLDTSVLAVEHERVLKVSREKDTEIRNFRSELEQKQSDLDYTKDMLQSTIDSQQCVTDLLGDKDKEIDFLKAENTALTDQNDNNTDVIKTQEAELHRLLAIETQYTNLSQDHRKAKTVIDKLKTRIKELESLEETEKVESVTLDIITDLEAEITSLRDKLETVDNTCTEQTSQLSSLTQQVDDRESAIENSTKEKEALQEMLQLNTQNMKEIDSNMSELTLTVEVKSETIRSQENAMTGLRGDIENLKQELNKSRSEFEQQKEDMLNRAETKDSKVLISTNNGLASSDDVNRLNKSPSAELFNGDYGAVEIENMQRMAEQQSNELVSLKEKNLELTQMLQSRSMANPALGDIHKLDGDMRSLRLEKEQMMQVLNDKTRECSQLKGEVHKLMSVVSAEKSALSKLQQDNHELRTRQDGGEQRNDDMQKEAVRNLSRIIRDKELEIESLNMKNQTLLQVLQDSSGEGVQISSLMQERDNLVKQISLFQSDREQIIAALSAKHQECLVYHTEIQRLNTQCNTDTAKSETLQQQYESLVVSYEDKQKCLVSTHEQLVTLRNEMSGLKSDLGEVRKKCAESDGRVRKLTQENGVLKQKCDQLLTQIETNRVNVKNTQVMKTNFNTTQVPSENSQTNGSVEHQIVQSDVSVNREVTIESTQLGGSATHAPQMCDHENELAGLRLVVHSQEQSLSDKDSIISLRNVEIIKLFKQLTERDSTVDDKDKELNELSSRFHKTEQMLRTRDTEINSIRKHNDSMTFQLKGFETELTDLRTERDQYQSKAGTLEQQIDMVKEANNKLSMALKDHAFELNALKEKNNTLTRLLQEKSSEGEEKGEMDRLMKETETLQHQAKVFKIDADQFAMALQQQQEENRELKTQMQKVSEKESKFSREVDRLRTHLVQVEDGYTRELLEAEEREKDLRNRLAGAEERALTASSSVDRANNHASKQIEALQLQLAAVSEQRDQVVLQLSAAREQAAQYAAESNNLHLVLEQFQQEKEQQQASEIEHYLREASTLKQDNRHLTEQLHDVQMQLNETTEALEAASRLSEQLDKKEQMVSALREEVQMREQQLSHAEGHIARLSASNNAKVDKALARNLILGYFHTPSNKKPEVLTIIARALDFEGDQLQQLQGEAAGGWLTGLFKKVVSTQTPPTTPARGDSAAINKSFSEALVKFMEKESTPEPEFKLPAEQMAFESQQRHGQHSQRSTPTFNPFSTPVSDLRGASTQSSQSVVHPLTVSISSGGGDHDRTGGRGRDTAHSSHLLMAPMSPRLPMFSASLMAGNTSQSQTSIQEESRTLSSSNVTSGQQTTSAILKDVLQQ